MKFSHPIHAAQVEYARQEARVVGLLDEIYGDLLEGKWSSFTTDHYDESIEVYGVTPTPEALGRLIAAGFDRVWQHDHTEDDPDRAERHKCGCGSLGRK